MDRNPENPMISIDKIPSLSARRAWIEIKLPPSRRKSPWVALRKESVDRNAATVKGMNRDDQSLSARRAWIEISIS